MWLGVLCAATLRSPFAPTYTAIGTLWLLAVAVGARGWPSWLGAIAWIVLQGTPPFDSPMSETIGSLPGQVASSAVAVAALWPRRRGLAAGVRPGTS